ncbi:hypothetical protein WMY93_031279 [Mugilogobius chulae]|uniref:Alpha-galactosidase n=1 Tax=Mugilogobius chulae TaxID=88201 RepID=A0AAW0MNI6_9GOBI
MCLCLDCGLCSGETTEILPSSLPWPALSRCVMLSRIFPGFGNVMKTVPSGNLSGFSSVLFLLVSSGFGCNYAPTLRRDVTIYLQTISYEKALLCPRLLELVERHIGLNIGSKLLCAKGFWRSLCTYNQTFCWSTDMFASALPLLVLTVVPLLPLVRSNDNGLALTPPMGWMAWERFRCDVDCNDDPVNCISEKLFRDMADRLSEDGWKELGYEYVIIDDCWMNRTRDHEGKLQPDANRFPSGIAHLADYVHNRGLKLGIYADMGSFTCMGFPGTPLHRIPLDAKTFADWGVDYLKFDGCNSNALQQFLGYPWMSQALNSTGRPIVYSCSWPVYVGSLPPEVNYTLLGEICHLWRNYYDIQDSWDSVQFIFDWFFNNQDYIQPAAGPGRWNDPDMLIIGNFGLSLDQAILQNKAAIAINQDALGIQGRRLLKEKSQIEVYWRPLVDSASTVVFLSRRSDMPYKYHTSLSKLGYGNGTYQVFDVFSQSQLQPLSSTQPFTVSINPSGVVMWHLTPTNRKAVFHRLHRLHRHRDKTRSHTVL